VLIGRIARRKAKKLQTPRAKVSDAGQNHIALNMRDSAGPAGCGVTVNLNASQAVTIATAGAASLRASQGREENPFLQGREENPFLSRP